MPNSKPSAHDAELGQPDQTTMANNKDVTPLKNTQPQRARGRIINAK